MYPDISVIMTAIAITVFVLLIGALILCNLLWQKILFYKYKTDFEQLIKKNNEQIETMRGNESRFMGKVATFLGGKDVIE